MADFTQFDFSEPVLKAVSDVGYEEPTPIQRAAIPVLLSGRDLIAQAQTGTGKTAAFALPIIERMDSEAPGPQTLVLAPTRELAVQVAQTFAQLGKFKDTRVLAVYGGQPIDRQLRALRYPLDVVVGTPGRIMDHLRRETLNLEHVKTLVLDEADEMLDMGFIEDVEWILDHMQGTRQTALFSATISNRIADLARRYMQNPERIVIAPEQVTVPRVTQGYYEIPGSAKVAALIRILDVEAPASAILFCRTKREVDELTQTLQAQGYPAEALHGDLNQTQRDRVMARFRSGQSPLLVATDVAARGLDIPEVSHVINYDIPSDPGDYVHRIGRTGRAGRPGTALTFVTPRERRLLRAIEQASGRRLTRRTIPTREEVAARQRAVLGASLAEVMQRDDLAAPMVLVNELAADHDPVQIAAAAIRLLLREREATDGLEPATEIPERGMRRLVLSLGRDDRIRPMDIVGAIANEARIPGKSIGQIEIFDRHTLVDVPEDLADRVVQALHGVRVRGREARVEVARPEQAMPQRSTRAPSAGRRREIEAPPRRQAVRGRRA